MKKMQLHPRHLDTPGSLEDAIGDYYATLLLIPTLCLPKLACSCSLIMGYPLLVGCSRSLYRPNQHSGGGGTLKFETSFFCHEHVPTKIHEGVGLGEDRALLHRPYWCLFASSSYLSM